MNAHCAIIMFDVTSSLSYQNLSYWYENIQRICGRIPVVVCGNKVELEAERKVKLQDISFHEQHQLQYFEISALACHNFVDPFLYLATKLSNQKDLYFLDKPVLKPREVEYNPKAIAILDDDFGSELSFSPREEDDNRGGRGRDGGVRITSNYSRQKDERSVDNGNSEADEGGEVLNDGISAYTEDA